MRKMSPLFHKSSHEIPGLNLASLPDLIFTVLFFFMIVTHMRDDDVRVHYQVPAGTEVSKLQQRQAVVNVYVGEGKIQVNGRMTDLAHVAECINEERKRMSPDNAERLTVSLKADKKTPMGLIADLKAELQKVFALKINYSGTVEKTR